MTRNPDSEPIRVIACGAIAREVVAICAQQGLNHIELDALPAIWHIRPDKIVPGLKAKIAKARAEGVSRIYLGYAECGTQGQIDKLCAEEGLDRLPGPHCYAFYTGTQRFLDACSDEITSFYLTDLIARQFEAFIVKPLKLDKHPELIAMVFGNYEKIVYLAQTDDPALDEKARQAADFLGLAYERRFTGYGDLATELAAL